MQLVVRTHTINYDSISKSISAWTSLDLRATVHLTRNPHDLLLDDFQFCHGVDGRLEMEHLATC